MDFSTELGVLRCLTRLAASMWIPYIVGVTGEPAHDGAPDPFLRPPRAIGDAALGPPRMARI